MAEQKHASASPLSIFLQSNPGVKFIHYQWLDLSGVLREMIVIASQALVHEAENKPHNVGCVPLRLLPNGDFSPRFTGLGRDYLWPDWSSLRVARFIADGETHALVACFVEESFAPGDDEPGRKSCPRSILQRAVEAARLDGLEFQIGLETEFILLDREKSVLEPTGIDAPASWCAAAAMQHPGVTACLDDIAKCIMASGINLLAFHSEGGVGAYEFVTAPNTVLRAVDEQIYIRQAIKTISQRHGFQATLYPAPYGSGSAIGAHCHLSITDPTPKIADGFLAGILARLPALCALAMPVHDSYRRVAEMKGRAGVWVAWGTENKDLPVRAIQGRVGYWELRAADFAANTYVQIAGWIAAGHLGVREGKELKCGDIDGEFTIPRENV